MDIRSGPSARQDIQYTTDDKVSDEPSFSLL